VDSRLLDIIVCPRCKTSLTEVDEERALFCDRCSNRYPVRDGIPVMLSEEAVDIRTGAHASNVSAGKFPLAKFRVIDGPDVNMTFQIERGTCRAVGRASVDPNRTAVFNVDIALELDETTRRLVLQYAGKQFRKAVSSGADSGSEIGSFRRVPDVVLTDAGLSRLHAMIFYDEMGIGILDLVSKNGTYVNSKEIESKLLTKDDVIEMGETTISFES